MYSSRKKILFFGELPPYTVHGASISNEINLLMLEEEYIVTRIIEKYSIRNHSSGYLIKAFFFIQSYLIFLRKIFLNNFSVFYGVIYLSTFGILKNFFLVIIYKLTHPKGKIVLHFHRSDFNIFVKNKFNKLIFKFLDFLVCRYVLLSDSQINDFRGTKNKYFVLSNTIQKEFTFPPKKSIISDTLKVIYLGNYIEEKGIIELIQAVILANENSISNKFELNLYGEFASENLKNKIYQLSKNNNFIKINGPIYNENKFLKIYESDLLALPSYNEGLPLVLLESISIGVPVVISNVGYIKDALGDNYPLYCEPKNVQSILNCLYDYLEIQDKNKLYEFVIDKYKKYSHQNHKINLLKIFNFEN